MYAPLLIGAWFPNRKIIVAPVLQWNLDNDPLPGDRDMNQLSYRQIIIYQPMNKWVSWLTLDPELIFDFEKDQETTLDIGVEYGKMINKTTALFIKPTFGVDSSNDWAIKVGMRFMFPEKTFFE